MNRLLVAFLFVFGTSVAFAQQMSDEQVVEYVTMAQAEGKSQEEIVPELLKRGITMVQYNRIKRNFENKRNAMGANKEIAAEERLRVAPMQTYNTDNRTEQYGGKEIFGHRIFQNKDVAFEANYNLPTPSNYKLGAGDQLVIDVWGASQSSIQKTISPDGNINVDNLGPIYLSGLTIEQANKVLKEEFGKIYSGINGEEPVSNIRLSLAQNRSIQVHVMGEVENPGTYMMSSFATVFNALYQAGGVSEVGTLRAVKVLRKNRMIATYDVYDFILNGNTGKGEMRLEDNDVVVVDAYQNLVHVTGAVKRPMFYEVLSGENLGQLLQYAGGPSENAYKEDVRVERNGKFEREIHTVAKEHLHEFVLLDGDVVSLDTIQTTYSNMVEVRGAVYRPGMFQMNGKVSTVKQLVECAGGLKDEAFLNRAILNRRKPNNTIENLAINLEQLMNGEIADIPLRKNDVLQVHEWAEVREVRTITVTGEVLFEGTYEYVDNMAIEDAVLNAGGLKETAAAVRVLVARRPKDAYATEELDSIAELFELTLNKDLEVIDNPSFVLMPFDEVIVRKSPGYNVQERVFIEGEVLFPGAYVLSSKYVTLSQLVEMSGGYTSEAYLHSAKLLRKKSENEKELEEKSLKTALELALTKEDSLSIMNQAKASEESYSVAINLAEAMENPGSEADIRLQEGDRLEIPRRIDVVKVSGEVMVANAIAYEEGRSLKYYVNQAGGYTDEARKSKIYVVHANGEVEKVGRRSHSIYPGSEIVISAKKKREGGMSAAQLISVSSAATSLATVVLTLLSVLKK